MSTGSRTALRLAPALLIMALAVAGPWFAPHDITAPRTAPYASPGPGTPLGGDQIGRDVLSRVLVGGRDLVLASLVVAAAVTGTAAVLGAAAALRPRFGAVLDRVADTVILLPAVLGVLVVGLSVPGSGRLPVVVTAVVLGIPFAARVTAAAAAPIAATGYVETAQAAGESLFSLVWREILPNLRATLLTLLGLRFAAAVGVVATAGFLQIGAQPPAADWALMIGENSDGVLLNPLAVLVPSAAIALLAVGVNLACDIAAARWRPKAVRGR
ncbi:ABC transporter permease [Amycolatopsis minnesotensis]|uniref:ABC transporter permease n=1 Tax=Amycolatopsis minnesotensis TaxID=337894 RepID=A0ABN2QRU2_9PSEU